MDRSKVSTFNYRKLESPDECDGSHKLTSRKSLGIFTFGILVGFFLNSFLVAVLITSQETDPATCLCDSAGGVEDLKSRNDASHAIVHTLENKTIAQRLSNEVRILCWVMTSPENHQRKAWHVKRTWGSRCNKLIFMSSEEDTELGAVALPVKEGRNNLYEKTKEAFKYIYEHHMDDADWFLKADDDTYVVLENLRYMLYPYSSEDPIYFGCKFKPYVKQGYMSGGAGYVLSKQAVRRFVEDGILNKNNCHTNYPEPAEDLEIGICLQKLKVFAGDSRDSLDRDRFMPFAPESHLIPGHIPKSLWYWNYTFYEAKVGLECCSDNAISFHYVSPTRMYIFDYLIYHLQPYGIVRNVQALPERISLADAIAKAQMTAQTIVHHDRNDSIRKKTKR